MKTIVLNGSSGFLGSQICKYFQNKYKIVRINRADYLIEPDKLARKIEGADVIINLAGKRIALFPNENQKKEIFDSRVKVTRNFVSAVELLDRSPEMFISMSAVGIYDTVHEHDETSNHFGNDFLANLCLQWEGEVVKSSLIKSSLIIRTGIVLSTKEGFLLKMLKPFGLGLGTVLGSGTQPLPFIHLDDFLRALEFSIDRHLNGIVNFVAPSFCTNELFAKSLAWTLNKPLLFRIPSWFVRLIMGQQSSMLLEGQQVSPAVLNNFGFQFLYPDIELTINNLISTKR